MSLDARAVAEAAARVSYGRLVAMLSSRSRDIAAAEDALSEAFAAALSVWPERGVPERPEAWLLTTARRVLGHGHRGAKVREAALGAIELAYEEMAARTPSDFPDERLKLLLIAAHPAIEEAVRTPLMLQVVLGLDASRIAAAFLTAPAAMGQRLVRAKAKIRDAGIGFETPDTDALPARLDDVLSAIYAAYGTGWDAVAGADDGSDRGLTAEAIYLGRLVADMLPGEPEVKGLLALMLHCEARRSARRSADGQFVPLDRQDTRLWSRNMIIEAESLLVAASRMGRFGRFQTEAAIQSVHAQRALTGRTNVDALVTLYDLLAERSPTVGVLVSRAAAHAENGNAAAALAMLGEIPMDRTSAYQPYWAVRAHVLRLLGRREEAGAVLDTAMALTSDPAVRSFLSEQGDVAERHDGRAVEE